MLFVKTNAYTYYAREKRGQVNYITISNRVSKKGGIRTEIILTMHALHERPLLDMVGNPEIPNLTGEAFTYYATG